jgi:hypothetical protein
MSSPGLNLGGRPGPPGENYRPRPSTFPGQHHRPIPGQLDLAGGEVDEHGRPLERRETNEDDG